MLRFKNLSDKAQNVAMISFKKSNKHKRYCERKINANLETFLEKDFGCYFKEMTKTELFIQEENEIKFSLSIYAKNPIEIGKILTLTYGNEAKQINPDEIKSIVIEKQKRGSFSVYIDAENFKELEKDISEWFEKYFSLYYFKILDSFENVLNDVEIWRYLRRGNVMFTKDGIMKE